MPFDFQAFFTAITGAIGTAYDVIRVPLATLLIGVGGCLTATGCGPYKWHAKTIESEMSTQFEVGYSSESKVFVGFPGKVKAKGTAQGEGDGTPKLETTTVPAVAPDNGAAR